LPSLDKGKGIEAPLKPHDTKWQKSRTNIMIMIMIMMMIMLMIMMMMMMMMMIMMMTMNLYSAKTIEEYSKALYIKFKKKNIKTVPTN